MAATRCLHCGNILRLCRACHCELNAVTWIYEHGAICVTCDASEQEQARQERDERLAARRAYLRQQQEPLTAAQIEAALAAARERKEG